MQALQSVRVFRSALSQKYLNPTYFSIILRKPVEPALESCCGDGCSHCVWVDYFEKKDQFKKSINFITRKIETNQINYTNFEGIYYTRDPEVIQKIEQPETGDIEIFRPIIKTPHFFIP